ncbi:MAG: hypothetical protein AAGJ37_11930 [Pseudomonadota bacterium]
MISFAIDNNVQLKMLELSEAQALYSLVDSNRDYLRQWLPWLDFNTSVRDSEAFVKSTLA